VTIKPAFEGKEMRERYGRYALSPCGIREVQPHLSPDRGDGDEIIQARKREAFNKLSVFLAPTI
jgi:hypothetical protein